MIIDVLFEILKIWLRLLVLIMVLIELLLMMVRDLFMIILLLVRIIGMLFSVRLKEIVFLEEVVLMASWREFVMLLRVEIIGIFSVFVGVKLVRNINVIKDLSSFWVIMILVYLKK